VLCHMTNVVGIQYFWNIALGIRLNMFYISSPHNTFIICLITIRMTIFIMPASCQDATYHCFQFPILKIPPMPSINISHKYFSWSTSTHAVIYGAICRIKRTFPKWIHTQALLSLSYISWTKIREHTTTVHAYVWS